MRIVIFAVVLALVTSVFAVTYSVATRKAELAAARAEAERRASLEIGALVADVDKFRVLPFVLIELPDVVAALSSESGSASRRLDLKLAALARQTGATVLYAVDATGTDRSASNARGADSFVGHDFRFRPYFVDAMRVGVGEYFAQGTVTGRPGLFLARRVGTKAAALGVVVVKIEFDRIERLWRTGGGLSLVADPDGIVIICSDPKLRFQSLSQLPSTRRAAISRSRQFGNASLADAGIKLDGQGFATDRSGLRYLVIERRLPLLGWRHVRLEPIQPAIDSANARVRLATLIFGLAVSALMVLVAWSATRQRRNEAARASLEQQVSRRTSELTDAYNSLRAEAEERERADSRYRAAREELAQANRLGSIGTITASVAHEMNQPVAAIRTAAENGFKLLRRGQPDRASANLKLIVSLTQRIGAITGELLSYARRGRLGPSTIALDDIVNGVLMLVGDSFRRAGVVLEVDRAPCLPRIRASRIRLEQVLVNILQNALDAVADRDGGFVRLEVAADDDMIRMSVHDNGPGLPQELGETVFLPFVTGKAHGTGLGLGISREIVADHGGTLTAGASPLGGAAFHATFPRFFEVCS